METAVATRPDGSTFEVPIYNCGWVVNGGKFVVPQSTLDELEKEKAYIQFTRGYVKQTYTVEQLVPIY